MPAAPDNTPSLTVAIVLYNSDTERLRDTMAAFWRAVDTAAVEGELRAVQLIVVDNASAAGYGERARPLVQAPPETGVPVTVSFLESPANLGFGGGHNLALARADGAVHLVLNPDVEFDPPALAAGLRCLRLHDKAVLVAPAGRGSRGEPEYLCKRYPSVLALAVRASGSATLQRWFRRTLERYEFRQQATASAPLPIELASGCCMLIRSGALRSTGGFDERYFLYFEDFDLSLRLAMHGELLLEPGMRIVHYGGYAARKGRAHVTLFLGSGWRFFRQHGWRWW